MGGLNSFRADGDCGNRFVAGCTAIPAARSLLGADYDPGRHPIIAGSGADRVLVAIFRDGAWSAGGGDGGEPIWTALARFRNWRVPFGVAMRFGAGRLERLPLCGNYVRASAVDCAAGSSMEDRFSPVRGSIHRDCGCFDFCRGVAGTGSGGDEEKVMIGKWPVSDEWRRAPKW